MPQDACLLVFVSVRTCFLHDWRQSPIRSVWSWARWHSSYCVYRAHFKASDLGRLTVPFVRNVFCAVINLTQATRCQAFHGSFLTGWEKLILYHNPDSSYKESLKTKVLLKKLSHPDSKHMYTRVCTQTYLPKHTRSRHTSVSRRERQDQGQATVCNCPQWLDTLSVCSRSFDWHRSTATLSNERLHLNNSLKRNSPTHARLYPIKCTFVYLY